MIDTNHLKMSTLKKSLKYVIKMQSYIDNNKL